MQMTRSAIAGFFCYFILSSGVAAADRQLVAGAGPSTEIVKLFFAEFSKTPECADTEFAVVEASVKHIGGIRNSDTFLFGRTGRPLSREEKSIGKSEILLGEIPIAFARGLEVKVKKLKLDAVEKIFTRKVTNWKDVGGPDAPILLVGREKNEAVYSVLREDFPFFQNVSFDRVFKNDDEVVQFLMSPAGRHAVGFGVQANFSDHNLLAVPEFSAGVQVGLVFDQKNATHPIIRAAQEFSTSGKWLTKIEKNGFLRVSGSNSQ
jgi:hypothetical protein